jgi:hypothetical protein
MFALALKTNYKILEERELVRQKTELSIATQLEQIRQDKEIEFGQKMLEQTATIQSSLAKQILNDWHKAEKEKQKGVHSTPAQVTIASAVNPVSTTSMHPIPTNQLLVDNLGETNQSSTKNQDPSLTNQVSVAHQNTHSLPAESKTQIDTPINTVLDTIQIANDNTLLKLLSGKKWYTHSNGLTDTYYFCDNGTQINALIKEPENGNRQLGRWQHPQGNSNLLHIDIEGKQSDFSITKLTEKNMQLTDSNGIKLEFAISNNG